MNVVPASLSLKIQERLFYVRHLTPADPRLVDLQQTVLQDMAWEQDLTSAMTVLHRLQRFELAAKLGVLDHPDIVDAFFDPQYPEWKDYASVPVSQERKNAMGDMLFGGSQNTDVSALVLAYDYTRDIAEHVVEKIIAKDQDVDIVIDDKNFKARILSVVDEETARKHGEYFAHRYEGLGRRIPIISNNSSVPYTGPEPSAENRKAESEGFLAVRGSNNWGTQDFTMTILPTEEDARRDGIAYADYLDIIFNMCAIDKDKIDQAHKFLIAKLNAASILHIQNDDGTDVTFDVDGQTFSNSLMEHNVPGTEVFSAPKRHGVNGRIVAKGNFVPFLDDRLVEDITLDFVDGRVVSYSAAVGQEYLAQKVEHDEGSHYLGEVAFGTNPYLIQHVANPLLVEKIGCSFHVALGHDLNAQDAKTTNGNNSDIHWDITTMLRGKNGRITLDGEVVMEKGLYIDKELAYLNGPQPHFS